MKKLNRRDFIQHSLIGAGALATLPAALRAAESAQSWKGSDVVPLGKTGIKVSRLAQGTGFNGGGRASDHSRLGREALEKLLRHGMDEGIRFLDMADLYGTHPYVKETIKGMNRDRYVLLSKIWTRKENWVQPSGGAVEEVDRFRKELGVDMIDVCLIHCMTDSGWAKSQDRVRDALSSLKQKGTVRAAGASCDEVGVWKDPAKGPWPDCML